MEFKTPEDIENERVEKLKEKAKADDALQVILGEIHETDKQITDLEIKKAELREVARKGRHNIRRLDTEIEVLKSEYFKARNR